MGADLAELPVVATDDLLAIEYGVMKQCESRAMARTDDFERPVAGATVTIYGKVIVEAGRTKDAEPLHDGEACSIHDRERLVGESCADCPSGLQVRGSHNLNVHGTLQKMLQKTLGHLPAITTVEQQPSFYHDVIGSDMIPSALQD